MTEFKVPSVACVETPATSETNHEVISFAVFLPRQAHAGASNRRTGSKRADVTVAKHGTGCASSDRLLIEHRRQVVLRRAIVDTV